MNRGELVKKIITHEVPQGHYKTDACVVWCFDARFSSLLDEFIRSHEFGNVDLVKVAGGAKSLTSPNEGHESDFLLSQIAASLALHHAPRVVLMVHGGCGAYGKKFLEPQEEQAFYCGELDAAAEIVRKFLADKRPEVEVLKYYADFSGLHKRD